jgi:hypothetical protein
MSRQSGWIIDGQFVYDRSCSRRHAEQTRARAKRKREAKLNSKPNDVASLEATEALRSNGE